MTTPLLKNALAPLVDRHRRLRGLFARGAAWFAAALAGAGFLLAHYRMPNAVLAALGAWLATRLLCRRWVAGWEPDYRTIARTIETQHPELHALLRTAVEQQPDPRTQQLGYLQQRVIADAVAATRRHQWLDTIPTSRWVAGYTALWLGLAALVGTFYFVKATPRAKPEPVAAAAKDPVTVTPGDTELERGSGLVVLAKFHRDVPSEAVLVLQPKNQPEQRLPLVKNLSDPVFGGGLPEVNADLSYRIEYAGQATRDFAVKVFEHPKLERADATLDFPDYTKLPEKKIPDTHRVSAVEGTKLGVTFNLNKPVKSATLVAKDGTKVPLAVQGDKPLAELRDFPLKASQTYELQLQDADGRANKLPAQFIVEALPNRRPEIKIATPKGDSRVSPIEEVTFRADVWDDFGLARYGLSYTLGAGAAKDLELGRETAADEKKSLMHLLKLETLEVKPDDLVSWYLWAEDTGPDGKLRRTATDMYFAEVRPFEEIFRQGEESEGKPGQGNETEKAAESQKQIVSATWNLQRAEEAAASAQPTPRYVKDLPVIRDAQADGLEKAKALGEKIEEAKSKALMENATKEMQAALDRLNEAEKDEAKLPDALASEKAAYNALLKLAAHQFNVSKSKSQSASKGGQKNQQQLDELELKEEKKRYETKSEADPKQNEQQKEQLAILNRLKELAQRQNDINERVKELQTALQEAKTEKEKEELQRQLKRLREEEQQMLADIDELKQKMEQSPQQAQLADERKQLDQTRGEAQKAAEAMEKKEASQALASGTRAQRELQQMRDDFRKKTSNQFRDEMREMRADARELAERQQGIAEQLGQEAGKPQRQTLDGSSEKEKLGAEFEKQQKQLGKITEDMKRVSEQAEAAEPLLAKELYDALRKSAQAGTGETLEKTQLLADRGYQPQARKFEEKARQEINDLKSGVERAAESVLGDEAEALRQARAELDALTQQLNREIAQARPDLAEADDAQPSPGSARAPRAGEGASPSRTSEGDRPEQASATQENGAPSEVRSGGAPEPAREARALPGAESRAAQNGERGKTPGAEGEEKQPNGEGKAGEQPGERERMAQNGEDSKDGKGSSKPGEQTGKQTGESGKERSAAQGGEGQKPGEQPGEGKGQPSGKRGQTAQNGQGAQPGENGQQPGEQGQGQKPGAGQQPGPGGQQPGNDSQTAQGQQPGQGKGGQDGKGDVAQQGQAGGDQAGQQNNRPGARIAELARDSRQRNGAEGRGGRWGGPTEGEQAGPLTGEKFVEWQDRLRNVEEMLDAPELRNEVARVREIAKGTRAEFKRHSVPPNWDLVDSKIRAPLAELRNRVTEELARRESKENIVPIDRDPVPTKYAERVRRYYEDLGRSR